MTGGVDIAWGRTGAVDPCEALCARSIAGSTAAEFWPSQSRTPGWRPDGRARVVLGNHLPIYVECEKPGLLPRKWNEVPMTEEPGSDPARHIRPFAAARIAGQPPLVTGSDGCDALEFIWGAPFP